MVTIGNKYKVIFEDEEGRVMEAPVIAMELSISREAPFFFNDPVAEGMPALSTLMYEINLRTTGNPLWIKKEDYKKRVVKRQKSCEWRCDFCGRPNQKADETCKGCGAVRSFLYEV